MDSKNSLKTLSSQLSEFPYVVSPETFIALHSYGFGVKKGPQYITDLIKFTTSTDKLYLKPLLFFSILQLVGLSKVWENIWILQCTQLKYRQI